MSKDHSTADRQLLRLAQQGSEAAWEAIYRRYVPSVWRYVCPRVDWNGHAAEDVISEVFVAALDGLKKLDSDHTPLYSWLIGVARHKLADRRRRIHRERGKEQLAASEIADPSVAGNPEKSAEAVERKAQITRAMARLSDDERLVLQWKYLDELPVREMAVRMERTEKAVENLLYRARRSFREVYGEMGAGPMGAEPRIG